MEALSDCSMLPAIMGSENAINVRVIGPSMKEAGRFLPIAGSAASLMASVLVSTVFCNFASILLVNLVDALLSAKTGPMP